MMFNDAIHFSRKRTAHEYTEASNTELLDDELLMTLRRRSNNAYVVIQDKKLPENL